MRVFAYLAGSGDEGISGQAIRLADLNNDGWIDVIHPATNQDAFGCVRHTKIFHNPGGAVGSTTIQLIEEKQQSATGGWFGAKGILYGDLLTGFDAAIFDLDNDGDLDMILGRCTGTFVWMNQTSTCQENLGYGGPGGSVLSLCGEELGSGKSATLRLQNAPPATTAWLVASLSNDPMPFKGGLLLPVPPLAIFALATDAAGKLSFSIGGGVGPAEVYAQFAVVDPAQPLGFGISNALRVEFLP